MTFQAKLLQAHIDVLNSTLKALKDAGIKIYDSNDFEFVINGYRYSQAQDKVMVEWVEDTEKDELECVSELFEETSELRRVV